MSRETFEWLNNNILIGFTDKRGNAWWDRGVTPNDGEPNHYTGAIPVADVERRLFDWEPVSSPIYAMTGIDTFTPIKGKQRIYPSDDAEHTFGIFSESYEPHGYKEWLIGNVSAILSDTLNISSAGMLKNRAVAWVEISVPETVHTPMGIDFRPNLLATTSFDGTTATTYKRTTTLTVCDNTRDAALAEDGATYKRRHTAQSNSKAEQDRARDILNLLSQDADAMSDELRRLCEWDISDVQFKEVLRLASIDPKTGKAPESKTGITVAERKASELEALYRHDSRVNPWKGTAFGVVQAFNTWEHHVKATRGDTNRVERNMLSAINGATGKSDALTLKWLDQAYATV
jgi:phage/plasmid-like protein (TIGR03299 family)